MTPAGLYIGACKGLVVCKGLVLDCTIRMCFCVFHDHTLYCEYHPIYIIGFS